MENNNTLCKENNTLDWCFMKDKLREIIFNAELWILKDGRLTLEPDQAIDQIIKLFLESLPEEIITMAKEGDWCNNDVRQGYNQCLKQVREILGGGE